VLASPGERRERSRPRRRWVDDALAILGLNAEQFPRSFAVFDRLGDAHAAAGHAAEAERCYREALTRFPGDGGYVREKLERLRPHASAPR